jgi:hypothetical protein
LRRADVALYDAKIAGRNRVVGAHPALLAAVGSDLSHVGTRVGAR